jgi:hypothetical protein
LALFVVVAQVRHVKARSPVRAHGYRDIFPIAKATVEQITAENCALRVDREEDRPNVVVRPEDAGVPKAYRDAAGFVEFGR